jgi:L,D-peptidoglycan transpeptidase YkuD (ErfK/YbiS/YcfS/YnhG family)
MMSLRVRMLNRLSQRCLLLMLAIPATGGVVMAADADNAWQSSRQMVLVVIPDWNTNHGVLRAYERKGSGWRPVDAAQPVTIGESGAAWGLGLNTPQAQGPQKHEGDGRSAAGVYRIGEAFGYAPATPTQMPYRALQESDYCMDVSGSPYYNRIVDERKVGEQGVAGSSEPMRRDLHLNGDQLYKVGFVIEHNAQGQAGAGSCIFAHVWRSPTAATAGCTAMPESAMRQLLAWLKPEDQPVFVLLPQDEYARLQKMWHLPALSSQGSR